MDYVEKPDQRRFTTKLQNGDSVYAVNLNVGVEKAGDRKVYTPSIDYTWPNKGTKRVFEGKIDYVKDKSLDFEFRPLGYASVEGQSVEGK